MLHFVLNITRGSTPTQLQLDGAAKQAKAVLVINGGRPETLQVEHEVCAIGPYERRIHYRMEKRADAGEEVREYPAAESVRSPEEEGVLEAIGGAHIERKRTGASRRPTVPQGLD